MGTRTGRLTPSRGRLLTLAAIAVLLVAMVTSTKFLTPAQAKTLNPLPFSPEQYAKDNFPKVTQMITEKAVDLTVLAPAYVADPSAAAKKYGQDLGSDSYDFPVRTSGVASDVDADFITLAVPGLPTGSVVRIPISDSINGAPVRDATGTMHYGDFPDQSTYQAVATQLGLRVRQDVVARANAARVKVLGFDGNPDAAKAVAAGEMVATVLQPIVKGSTMAVDQADQYLKTGKTGASSEKQAIDCVLITKDDVAKLSNFILSS